MPNHFDDCFAAGGETISHVGPMLDDNDEVHQWATRPASRR
jgi:hypothetical protein